ncbi:cell division protein FtsQ/DivIB [Gordonia soli]|uniref:Cell division protein FtsQ n=1 Tax=Gordonia soli NBRC 108243 TaxID=1223545 RepID=M0QRC1_9ACTN|nr:FtsQ-type POTRA domain-containing protein [Gordonia soli]GAC70032.1 cell division protein FtsQ [Gordonia soli NBRC 108243]
MRARAPRRGRLLLGTVLVVALFAGLAAIAYYTPLMSVRSTEVRDNKTVSADDIRRAADVPGGTPLLRVDTQAVALRVAAIPSVESARVQRTYPSELTITVVERQPVAIVEQDQKIHVLDRGGVGYLEFDRRQGVPPETLRLPVLDTPNPGPTDPSTKAALSAVAGLPDDLAKKVRRVEASSPVDIQFRIDGDKRVVWGDSDRGAEKARTLGVLLSRKGTVYNVSSPEFPAYR